MFHSSSTRIAAGGLCTGLRMSSSPGACWPWRRPTPRAWSPALPFGRVGRVPHPAPLAPVQTEHLPKPDRAEASWSKRSSTRPATRSGCIPAPQAALRPPTKGRLARFLRPVSSRCCHWPHSRRSTGAIVGGGQDFGHAVHRPNPTEGHEAERPHHRLPVYNEANTLLIAVKRLLETELPIRSRSCWFGRRFVDGSLDTVRDL